MSSALSTAQGCQERQRTVENPHIQALQLACWSSTTALLCFIDMQITSYLPLKHHWSSKKIIKNTLYKMKVLTRFRFRCETCSWDLLWESQFCRWSLRQLWQRLQELLCQVWAQVGSLGLSSPTQELMWGWWEWVYNIYNDFINVSFCLFPSEMRNVERFSVKGEQIDLWLVPMLFP